MVFPTSSSQPQKWSWGPIECRHSLRAQQWVVAVHEAGEPPALGAAPQFSNHVGKSLLWQRATPNTGNIFYEMCLGQSIDSREKWFAIFDEVSEALNKSPIGSSDTDLHDTSAMSPQTRRGQLVSTAHIAQKLRASLTTERHRRCSPFVDHPRAYHR